MKWHKIIKVSYSALLREKFQKIAKKMGHPYLINNIEVDGSFISILYNFKIKGKEVKIMDERSLQIWNTADRKYHDWGEDEITQLLKAVVRSFELLAQVTNNPSVEVKNGKILVTGAENPKTGKTSQYIIYPNAQLNEGCHKLATYPTLYPMCITMENEGLPTGDNLATLILTLLNDDKAVELEGIRDYTQGEFRFTCYMCGESNGATIDNLRPQRLIEQLKVAYRHGFLPSYTPISNGLWQNTDLVDCKGCRYIYRIHGVRFYPDLDFDRDEVGVIYSHYGKNILIRRGRLSYDVPSRTFTILEGENAGYTFSGKFNPNDDSIPELKEPESTDSPYDMYKQKNLSSKYTYTVNMKWSEYLKKSSVQEKDWENSLKSIISEGKKLGVPLSVMELLKLAKEATTSQSEGFETLHRPTFDEEEEEDV